MELDTEQIRWQGILNDLMTLLLKHKLSLGQTQILFDKVLDMQKQIALDNPIKNIDTSVRGDKQIRG